MGNRQYNATGYSPDPPASGYWTAPTRTHAAGRHSYSAPNPNSSSAHSYCRRYFWWVILSSSLILFTLLFMLASFAIISDIYFGPEPPEFRLTSFYLTGFTLSSSTLSGNWTASLSVVNPNKKFRVRYEMLYGALYYRSDSIVINRFPLFDQERESMANLSTTFVAAETYVDGSMVSGINGERSRGGVEFNLRFAVVAHFMPPGRFSEKQRLRVYCDHLTVEVSSDSTVGALTGGPRKCTLGSFGIYDDCILGVVGFS